MIRSSEKKYKILFTQKLKNSDYKKIENVEVEEIPFIQIKKDREVTIEYTPQSYFIVSSKNAIFSLDGLKGIQNKFFVVGEKTTLLLKEKGFKIEKSVNYSQELIEILKEYPPLDLIFLSGNIRKEELPNYIKSSGHGFTEFIVYDTIFASKKINNDFDAIVFLSPSAVKSYFLKNCLPKEICIFVIGNTTKKAVLAYGEYNIVVPKKPTIGALIKKINKKFNVKK